ncbi:MarR family winged helix-turn-helix transcriptional regulator [Chryseobacterium sp. JM1]|uniref:MarR family winged helix-turn-helix transcriptional regulator n=1 Tax=Chryseobacterium sp. JM1 TaxID=1233950 RepID=UPI0004E699A6|nr:helix-turn-helix domain-containing protein [Chryseobacterium sp. JM1]KFF18718.1 MarR family transcriptional regulator [Chryseobacterium sp. JM1]
MFHSPFNLNQQNHEIDSKIVVALERLSEAFRVLLWNESKLNALSPIQIQILIFLLFQPTEKCRISYLAKEFNMSKPTISDSVKSLLQKGLIDKKSDLLDSRSYTLSLTDSGRITALKSADFTRSIENPVSSLNLQQKEIMLDGLLKIIQGLNTTGILTVQRMCFTCSHYRISDEGHYCKLLQMSLAYKEIRINCAEHAAII